MGGYTKLTTHHDLKLTILKLQENISNHALSASHDFYKYLLVVQKHCLGLRANFCICATWNSNYMILTSPGEKKSYCNCYQDNITNTDWNLCEYKQKPLHFSRYSAFKSIKAGEYLTYTACFLPLMPDEEFIIKYVREEFATTKILYLHIKLITSLSLGTLSALRTCSNIYVYFLHIN